MRSCSVKGCERPFKAKGLCSPHYWAQPERKAAQSKYHKRWYAERREEKQAQNSRWSRANRPKRAEAARRRRQKDVVGARAKAVAWQKTPQGKASTRAATARRRAQKILATPRWAELGPIQKFYGACPAGFHVDHAVPLNSEIVCGLHVLANLQYLPAAENLRKSNRLERV